VFNVYHEKCQNPVLNSPFLTPVILSVCTSAAQTVARNLVAGSVPGQAPAMIQACWSNRCGESSAASESKYAQISLFIFHHKWQTLPVVECLATLVSLFITNNVENSVSTPIS
jgi:hypothetical protein